MHREPRLSVMSVPLMSILAEDCDKNDPGKEKEKHKDPREDAKVPRGQDEEENKEGGAEPFLDEDGDLNVKHRPQRNSVDGGRDLVCPVILKQSVPVVDLEEENVDDEEGYCTEDVLRIEHTMATPLEDVGKQVWRGALLLADFILSKSDLFRGSTVLELGAGTGLPSIVMATTAKTVYCTDVGEDLLGSCKRNVSLNQHIIEPTGGEVRVKQLDWLQHSLCREADLEFSWTEEEVADLYDNTSFIIAADVCYDDDLTDGFFRTLYRLCSSFLHTCTVFISIEKRMNFTLRHMDITCEAYDHFRDGLSQLQDLLKGRRTFRVEKVPLNFSQFLLYERVEQLELWKLSSAPLSSERAQSAPTLPSP